MFGLSTARAALSAPATVQAMVMSVPGEENGASGVPCTGQLGWVTTERLMVFLGVVEVDLAGPVVPRGGRAELDLPLVAVALALGRAVPLLLVFASTVGVEAW